MCIQEPSIPSTHPLEKVTDRLLTPIALIYLQVQPCANYVLN